MLRLSSEKNYALDTFKSNENFVENLFPEILNSIFSKVDSFGLQALANTSKYISSVAVRASQDESKTIKIFIDALCEGLNSEIFPVEKEKLRAISDEIKFFETHSLVETRTKIYEIREKIIDFLNEHKIKTFKENLETFPYSIQRQCVPKFFEHLYKLVDIYLSYKFEIATDEWIEENEILGFSTYEWDIIWHDNLKSDSSKHIGIAKTIQDTAIKSLALYTISRYMHPPSKALEIANIIPNKLKKNEALCEIIDDFRTHEFNEFSDAITFFLTVVNNIEGEDVKSKCLASLADDCLRAGYPEEGLKLAELITVGEKKVAITQEILKVLNVKNEAFNLLKRGLIIESINYVINEAYFTTSLMAVYNNFNIIRTFEGMINELIETKNYNAASIFLRSIPNQNGDAYKGWVKKLMTALINDDFFGSAFYVASFITNGNLK